jgi:hypothetical protein
VKNTLRTPYFLTLLASLGLVLAPIGCGGKSDESADDDDETTGDGDGDQTGDGDGDGDTGDGDGDTGDGDGDTTGDGDGDGDPGCVAGNGGGGNGAVCTSNAECDSCNCYLVPFLGGQCGECDNVDGDKDCAEITGGGCTPPNPFENNGSTCNMGEAGGGCQSSDVCAEGLSCGNVLSLLGVVEINTCGECASDADCDGGDICAPIVVVEEFNGQNTCIVPGTLPQHSFCNIGAAGDAACMDICSTVDIMGLAQVGACGECKNNDDCNGGTCTFGAFDIGNGTLTGSVCSN